MRNHVLVTILIVKSLVETSRSKCDIRYVTTNHVYICLAYVKCCGDNVPVMVMNYIWRSVWNNHRLHTPFNMNSLGLSLILKMGCICTRETIQINSRKYYVLEHLGEG